MRFSIFNLHLLKRKGHISLEEVADRGGMACQDQSRESDQGVVVSPRAVLGQEKIDRVIHGCSAVLPLNHVSTNLADDLDDATHSSMDKAVLLDTGGDPNEQRLSIPLHCIAVNSNGKLNPKYEQRTSTFGTSRVANRANASIVQENTNALFSIAVVAY